MLKVKAVPEGEARVTGTDDIVPGRFVAVDSGTGFGERDDVGGRAGDGLGDGLGDGQKSRGFGGRLGAVWARLVPGLGAAWGQQASGQRRWWLGRRGSFCGKLAWLSGWKRGFHTPAPPWDI